MIPGLDPVRYLDSRTLAPARRTGYDYILAGNGVMKRAHSRHVDACLPLVRCRIAGLPDLDPYVVRRFPRIPGAMLRAALDDARRIARAHPREAMYHVYWGGDKFRLGRPRQDATAGRVRYAGGDDPAIVLDLHSHCEAGAFFSHTDDGDEKGFRFYGVMARIFTRPMLGVRLGIYGDHWPIGPDLLFDDVGPFTPAGDLAGRRSRRLMEGAW